MHRYITIPFVPAGIWRLSVSWAPIPFCAPYHPFNCHWSLNIGIDGTISNRAIWRDREQILKGDRLPLAVRTLPSDPAAASSNEYTSRKGIRFEIAGWLQIAG